MKTERMESLTHDFMGREAVQELKSLSSVLQRHAFEAQGLFAA